MEPSDWTLAFMFSWNATRMESSVSGQPKSLSMLYKSKWLTVSKALVRSMKTTYSRRDCSTLVSWSCLSENTMSDELLEGESHIDSQVEFCQQSDGLWARGDEQKLRVMMFVSLKSSRRHRLFQNIVNMRESTVSRGLPPLFKTSRGCHLAQEISSS